jgi:hypothetical protein
MDATYKAGVTDNPTYLLSITIDGHTKEVEDYVGSWEGMPAVVTELEDEVDTFARTLRWIDSSDGLVQALQAEKFNFKTFEAQVMVKESASRGMAGMVREFLEAGVPLKPLPAPKLKEPYMAVPFEAVGWLNAASSHPEALQVLIDAAASKNDQRDKDLALSIIRTWRCETAREKLLYSQQENIATEMKKMVRVWNACVYLLRLVPM